MLNLQVDPRLQQLTPSPRATKRKRGSSLDGDKLEIVNENLNAEYGLWVFQIFKQDIYDTSERIKTTQSGRFDANMRSFCDVRNAEEASNTLLFT